jgi:putative endonuclease
MYEKSFHVYIMSNYKKDVYYTGVTNNIIRRIIEHKLGFGSKFTKLYNLKYLVYYEEFGDIRNAIAREKETKGWKRYKKVNLIMSKNSTMKDLTNDLYNDYEMSEKDIKECENDIKELYRN